MPILWHQTTSCRCKRVNEDELTLLFLLPLFIVATFATDFLDSCGLIPLSIHRAHINPPII